MKYFQKLKCEDCGYGTIADDFGEEIICLYCKGSGIIKGVDITSTIKPILGGIKLMEYRKGSYGKDGFYSRLTREKWNSHLVQLKQIILANVIKVKDG